MQHRNNKTFKYFYDKNLFVQFKKMLNQILFTIEIYFLYIFSFHANFFLYLNLFLIVLFTECRRAMHLKFFLDATHLKQVIQWILIWPNTKYLVAECEIPMKFNTCAKHSIFIIWVIMSTFLKKTSVNFFKNKFFKFVLLFFCCNSSQWLYKLNLNF